MKSGLPLQKRLIHQVVLLSKGHGRATNNSKNEIDVPSWLGYLQKFAEINFVGQQFLKPYPLTGQTTKILSLENFEL